jgi:pimeloyl-ACP methyl ester carboxylesterase
MLSRTPLDGYLGTCAAIRDADLEAVARAISSPTVCLVGSEDGATPPALVQDLATAITGAHYQEIAGVGHLPMIEQPDQVSMILNRQVLGAKG